MSCKRVMEDGEVIAPMFDKNNVMGSIYVDSIRVGDTLSLDRELRLTIDKISDSEGNVWVPLYTDEDEINKGETPGIRINMSILTLLQEAVQYEESKGLVINPFGQSLIIPKDAIKAVLDTYEKNISGEQRD